MNILCGTDIIEIDRIKETIDDLGDKFLNKVYTDQEIEYCESKKSQKYQHYAARFAAKEATFKAVSNLLDSKYDISWKNIQVYNDDNQKPHISFIAINFETIKQIEVSISHCKNYATATVIITLEV